MYKSLSLFITSIVPLPHRHTAGTVLHFQSLRLPLEVSSPSLSPFLVGSHQSTAIIALRRFAVKHRHHRRPFVCLLLLAVDRFAAHLRPSFSSTASHKKKGTDFGFRSKENKHKPLLVKELKKVFEDVKKGGPYTASNTLLIDDKSYNVVQVPKQPNGIDCGYYVMKFMKEIVQHHEADKIPQMECIVGLIKI